jgi:arylsulfatase A-like enzyme
VWLYTVINFFMIKVILLPAVMLMALYACKEKPAEKAATRPNVIVIVTDDHAKNAVSAYGSKLLQTPNIDRIAREGIRFDHAFVTNSLCGPARAVILTGKYSHINGFRDNNDKFDNSQPTITKMLQQSGYYTAVVGKWHLVTEPTGFDYWNILIDQGSYYNPDFVEMGDTTVRPGYATDVITDIAFKTLDNRPKDKPFCLMLHQKAPHRNWMPNLKHLGMFDSTEVPLPPTLFDDYKTRTAAAKEQDMEIRKMFHAYDLKLKIPKGKTDPGTGGHAGGDGMKFWEGDYKRFTDEQKRLWDEYYKPISDAFYKSNLKGKPLEEWMYQRYIKDYLSCVVSVDENIGRLLTYLEENKLLDNTLIIYTSDQGFFLGEHGWYDKRFMYEESLGIPLVIRYPEKITAGQVNQNLVMNLDIAPTILDAAGIGIPADLQGESLLSLGPESSRSWRKSIYYHYYEFPYGAHKVKKHYGVRTDRYKLIHFYNDIDDWELYDLKLDPYELNNIYPRKDTRSLSDSLKTVLNSLRSHYLDTAKLETINQ